jgi:hypothetical protein
VEVPAELVNKLHFEGFDDNLAEKVKNYNPSKMGENGGKKTKKEIYEEIIKKSKLMKHEKQKQKEDDQTKFIELNDNYN